jgi:hypothetical protein
LFWELDWFALTLCSVTSGLDNAVSPDGDGDISAMAAGELAAEAA